MAESHTGFFYIYGHCEPIGPRGYETRGPRSAPIFIGVFHPFLSILILPVV